MQATHEVLNQPEPLVNYNLFEGNRALRAALALNAPELDTAVAGGAGREARQCRNADARAAGQHSHARVAQPRPLRAAHRPGRIPSELPRAHGCGRRGRHPRHAVGARRRVAARASRGVVHALHRARAVGAVPDLHDVRGAAGPAARTPPSTATGARNSATGSTTRPSRSWRDKAGLTMGMGMTEKQGGSDVRANTSEATPDGKDEWGQRFRITGHKWFLSAPMCDAFLVLAQSPGGLSCFFMPRVLPDGSRQRDVHPAPEGQAGQQGQRQLRSGVRRRHRVAGGRRGPRRAADPRDGLDDAHGLRARHQRPDAPCLVDRAGPHGAARSLRQAAHRPAPDAQRAGGSGAGIGSIHGVGAAHRAGLRQARRRARNRDRPPA